jgi:CRP/FNR family cyclic AMP-dependent transcriptional regulator
MDALNALQNMPLFAGLDHAALVELSKVAIRRKFSKNTVLFSKGDEGDSIYFIAAGRVKAIVNDDNGREIVLNQFGPGEFFGEFALLDGKPRSATVVTKEAIEAIVIRRNDFHRLVLSQSEVVEKLMGTLLRKLREATDKIESLSFHSVYDRINQLLLKLSSPVDGDLVICEKLTHKDIANMVGASREMVSKIMKQLEVGGYIDFEKKCLKIIKDFPKEF